jgi:hypothetical protein
MQYVIQNISSLSDTDINKSMFLMLDNIADLPVHIGFLFNKRYYAVTANKVYSDVNAEVVLNNISKKKTPVIFYKLINNSAWSNCRIKDYFKNIRPLNETYYRQHTCLDPIAQLLSRLYEWTDSNAPGFENVFELLNKLYKYNIIQAVYHLHCEKYIVDDCIKLNTYTRQDTINKILRLIEANYVKGR